MTEKTDEPVLGTLESLLEDTSGMLQKRLYVVFTVPSPGMQEKIAEMTEKHLQYQVELEQKGIMFAAGPFLNRDEKTMPEEGMIIYRAKSLAEARQIAEADPMHSAGARAYTIRPWVLNEGKINISIELSNGTFSFD